MQSAPTKLESLTPPRPVKPTTERKPDSSHSTHRMKAELLSSTPRKHEAPHESHVRNMRFESFTPGPVEVLSRECQKRGYNPSFGLSGNIATGFNCDVRLLDRVFRGDKVWATEASAKGAVARKALALQDTWPPKQPPAFIEMQRSRAPQRVTGPQDAGRYAGPIPSMTIAEQRYFEDQKRVTRAQEDQQRATQYVTRAHDAAREEYAGQHQQPIPQTGVTIPGEYAIHPMASRAFLEGYQLGHRAAAALIQRPVRGRSRSRSPRVIERKENVVRARSPFLSGIPTGPGAPRRRVSRTPGVESVSKKKSGMDWSSPARAGGDYYPMNVVDRAYPTAGAPAPGDVRGPKMDQYYSVSRPYCRTSCDLSDDFFWYSNRGFERNFGFGAQQTSLRATRERKGSPSDTPEQAIRYQRVTRSGHRDRTGMVVALMRFENISCAAAILLLGPSC